MQRLRSPGVVSLLLLLAARFCLGQTCVMAEPPSDFCTTAREIPGAVGQHVVLMDVHNATGTSTICGVPAGQTVWFKVVPEVSGPLVFSTCHPATTYDTVVQAYRGGDSMCDFMEAIDCNDDSPDPECDNGCSSFGSRIEIAAEAGEIYRFEVGSYNSNSAGCVLCLGVIVTIGEPCGEPPRNLDCQLAMELPGEPGEHQAMVDVQDAVVLPSEPQPGCVQTPVGHSVWFQTTPLVNGPITFSTCHPNTTYDTVVAAYVGDCAGFLAAIDCNDDTLAPPCSNACGENVGSVVSFEGEAGMTYYFQVGSYNSNQAQCDLCLGVYLTIEDVCEGETTPPVAEIDVPTDLNCVCNPVEIVGSASDPDGTFQGYLLEQRAAGAATWTTIGNGAEPVENGPLGTWDTTGLPQGYYTLRLTAYNGCGMASTDVVVVFLGAVFDNLTIRSPGENAVVGGTVCIDGTAWDSYCFDSYQVGYRPVGGGAFQPVDAGTPVYTATVINDPLAQWDTVGLGIPDGDYQIRATAQDDCGSTSTALVSRVTVDNTAPVAVIGPPTPCTHVEGSVDIRGTAQDANLAGWSLAYTGGDAHGWVTIASGNTPVIDGFLRSWDTSGLRACAYTIRLIVADNAVLNCNGAVHHQSEYTVSVNAGPRAGTMEIR